MCGLLAGLADTAHDDVLDIHGIDARAVDQRIEHSGGEIGRMPARQPAAFASAGGARGGDDIGLDHERSPFSACFGALLMGRIKRSQKSLVNRSINS